MPFGESKIGGKIGREETSKPKEASKDIESIRKEINEKYPEEFKSQEQHINSMRGYTDKVKNEYPEYDNVKKYAEGGGFGEVLISDCKGTRFEAQSLFNAIVIPKTLFPKFETIHNVDPDFFDKAMKYTFGNIEEEISGHEKEHSKNLAMKVYPKTFEIAVKQHRAYLKTKILEGALLDKELKKSAEKGEFYVESQRILKHSKSAKEVIDAIAIPNVFWILLDYGIEKGLTKEMNKEYFRKQLSESPDKNSGEVKGLYPYLKEDAINKKDVINDLIERVEEIRKDLKQKYEEKYGKIEKPKESK